MSVSVELDLDVALVLLEMLASREKLAEQLGIEAPERNSLRAFQAALERQLVAPFGADYASRLAAARESVVARLG